MNIDKIPYTPSYVVDTGKLRKNLEVLNDVQNRTKCSVLLALKGFSMFSVFPIVREYLPGVAASSLDEARLGADEFGRQVHLCAPAYRGEEFDELIRYSDHIVFNSFSQWERFAPRVASSGKDIKCGLRINPEHSEVKIPLYDPCVKGSRLGITREKFTGRDLSGITGLHFHTLCELGPDSLERTLKAIESNFGAILYQMEWVNFGGGHHVTREDYDVDLLCSLINEFKDRYDVDVYLEPGEAIALDAGVMVASVLDVIDNNGKIAILDTSASAHMPDVIEMPYRPKVQGAASPAELAHTYLLGGMTCLAGDVIGEYSFSEPLKPGDRLVFEDMAHYTMVKNNTFNGIRLPSIAVYDPDKDEITEVKRFGYEDYKGRLS